MARDTYDMTSPTRFLSSGLGIAKYIPPTDALSGFKPRCPLRQPSTLPVVVKLFMNICCSRVAIVIPSTVPSLPSSLCSRTARHHSHVCIMYHDIDDIYIYIYIHIAQELQNVFLPPYPAHACHVLGMVREGPIKYIYIYIYIYIIQTYNI